MSKADQVAARIATLLRDLQVSDFDTDRMEACFGVYGDLPIVYVSLPDCAVLVDGTTGAVAGPYKLHEQMSASELLAAHSEFSAAAGPSRLFSSMGCAPVAAAWNDEPPSRSVPGDWRPFPCAPAPCVPGRPADWRCVDVAPTPGTSICECEREEVYWLPTIPSGYPASNPGILKVKVRCQKPGGCDTTPPNRGAWPGAPYGCNVKKYYY